MFSINKVALYTLFFSHIAMAHQLTPEYKILAERWTESIIGTPGQQYDDFQLNMISNINQVAENNLKLLNISDDRNELWSDLPFDYSQGGLSVGKNIRSSMIRLLEMAKSYRFQGKLQGDSELLSSIINSLDYLVTEHYRVGAQEYGNWWDWEIGIPKTLNDILTLIYSDLSQVQIKRYTDASRYFSPLPDRNGVSEGAGASSNPVNREATGGNRTDMVQIVLLRGIMSEREDEILKALQALPQVLESVTSDDGFYSDGSFIQHGDIPYTGTYGNVLLEGIGKVMNLMANSKWPADDPGLLRIYHILYDSFFPFLYSGQMLDMQNGRAISRGDRQNHVEGHAVLSSMLRFMDGAAASDKNKLSAFVKWQIESDHAKNFFDGLQDFHIYNKAKSLLEDETIMPAKILQRAYFFPDMDRFVYNSNDYTFSLALHSARVGNFECMNDENRKGWFTGDGATYIYNADLEQYTDYWPLISPYRIPGTTIDMTTTLDDCTNKNKVASRVGKNRQVKMQRVGGAVYTTEAAIGADFYNHADSISALKSWFVLNDKVVAIGSDIQSGDNINVGTIVDSRKLNKNGDNRIEINGIADSIHNKKVYENVNSLFVEGNVKGANMGYWFPKKENVTIEHLNVSANWSDIGTTKKPVSGHTLSSFISQNEHQSGYQYVMLNGISSKDLNEYTLNPDVIVIRADNKAHIVGDVNETSLLANVWGNGEVSFRGLKISDPVSVIIKRSLGELEISLSDPTRTLPQVTLITDDNFNVKSDQDGRVSIKGNTVVVNLESLSGRTYHFSLQSDNGSDLEGEGGENTSGGGAIDLLMMLVLGAYGWRRAASA